MSSVLNTYILVVVVARAVYSRLQDYRRVEKEVELYRENNMEVVMNLHYPEAQK